MKKALLKSFMGHFKSLLGKNFVYLGQKAKALLRNVAEIKRMLWLLLNSDSVNFYVYLTDLRSNDIDEAFSIFKFADEDTTRLIERLSQLAKSRIMML